MSTSRATSSGTMTTPPPSPVSEPRKPAATAPSQTIRVNSRVFTDDSRGRQRTEDRSQGAVRVLVTGTILVPKLCLGTRRLFSVLRPLSSICLRQYTHRPRNGQRLTGGRFGGNG